MDLTAANGWQNHGSQAERRLAAGARARGRRRAWRDGASSRFRRVAGRPSPCGRARTIEVINTHGTQVVDCWAFSAANPGEFMSMEHCRVSLGKVRPGVGDVMVTNQRRPILKVVADTFPGVHDTLMAACDRTRYELLGCKTYHRNCTDRPVGGAPRDRSPTHGDPVSLGPLPEHAGRGRRQHR